jgi:hypothetical protein
MDYFPVRVHPAGRRVLPSSIPDQSFREMTPVRSMKIPDWLERAARWTEGIIHALLDTAFNDRRSRASRWIGHVWAFGLFVAGALAWRYFFNSGYFQLDIHDWLEASKRYAFLHDAIMTGQLPLHMPGTSALRTVTDRFMAVADTTISPQVLLLRYLDIGHFVVVNVVGLYSLGFIGLLILRERFKLSPAAFTLMYLLFMFNGHISDHLAVGHVHWAGYFLIPFFAALIFKLLDGDVGWRWVFAMSGLLFIIFLQGTFHLFIMCLAFMAILAVFSRKHLMPLAGGILFSILLSMIRILPPALDASKFDTEFLFGFTTVGDVYAALTNLKIPGFNEIVIRGSVNPLGYWELDHYIGMVGLALVVIFGVLPWFRSGASRKRYHALWLPISALAIASVGQVYQVVHVLHIPMFSSQRVSSRFLFLPLAMLIFLGVIHLQEYFSNQKSSDWVRLVELAVVGVAAQDLWQHFKSWRVTNMGKVFSPQPLDLSLYYVANHPDPPYITVLIIGLVITVVTLGFLIVMSVREQRRRSAHPS